MGEAYSLEEHQLVCAPVLPLTKKKKRGGESSEVSGSGEKSRLQI